MANTKSAAKRGRQTLGRTARNKSIRTGIRTQQKRFRAAAASGDHQKALAEYKLLASRLDKASKRKVVHPNLANRRKSRAALLLASQTASKNTAGSADKPVDQQTDE
jgi:small subunit ribosomal protein S20